MIIEDGQGTGNKAGVSTTGLLQAEVKTHSDAFYENLNNKSAYIMELPAVILGSSWVWAAIKNTDDKDLVIVRCVLWVATAKSGDFVSAYTRGTFTYATNGTSATPSQCNSGTALSASGSFYYNDAVGDMTTIGAGQACGTVLLNTAPQEFCVTARWVVPKNQTWYLKSELSNDNTYKGYIEFYYHNS